VIERGPLLEVRDLSVTFPSEAGTVQAVRSLSYTLRAGEVLGVVGESGSGKTVSSLAIMNLLPPSARVLGSIRFDGEELLGRSDQELSKLRGRRIAMIFQDPLSALTPVYTVGQQLVEAIRAHRDIDAAAASARAIELLSLVGIPNPERRFTSFPHEFSGGMRQRVLIAMAIANDPALIIADEPTTALDVTVQAQILDLLKKARDLTGAAVLLITHDLGVVAGLADRIGVMYAGKLVETGTVETVFRQPHMPYTLGLLGSVPRPDAAKEHGLTPIEGSPPSLVALPQGCSFGPRCPLRADICAEREPELTSAAGAGDAHGAACHRSQEIASRSLRGVDVFPAPTRFVAPRARPRAERPVVLDVRGLVKDFPVMRGSVFRRRVGALRAVDGVTFDVREGETLGIVGESGCGKTTTIIEILNLTRPQAGSVAVLGRDTATMTPDQRFRVRRDVQVVFQDPMASLDPRMPVGEIIGEPLETHGISASDRLQRVRELLSLVGLEPAHAARYPQAFSGGQRQRIGIARALALNPKLLILDEPVSALDVSIRAGIINLLEKLRAELKLSYLIVAHDLAVMRHIADRIAVMYLGRIVELGDVEDVFSRPLHPYTQALLSAVPIPDPERERRRTRILLEGDLPSPLDPPQGCRFRPRCHRFAAHLTDEERQLCHTEPALAVRSGSATHEDACHYSRQAPAA
jgi:peptide/nickel transport system ATP-binding protein